MHGAEDVLKVLLAGADVAMQASALLQRGPGTASAEIETDLARWLEEREYDVGGAAQGERVAGQPSADPEAFERANYRRTLRSWSSSFPS